MRARESELGAEHAEVAVEQQHLASVARLAGDTDGAAGMLERVRPPTASSPPSTTSPTPHRTALQAVRILEAEVASASAADGSTDGSIVRRLRSLQSSLAGALNSLGLLRKQQRRFADARVSVVPPPARRRARLSPLFPRRGSAWPRCSPSSLAIATWHCLLTAASHGCVQGAHERASALHDAAVGEGHPDAIVCRYSCAPRPCASLSRPQVTSTSARPTS